MTIRGISNRLGRSRVWLRLAALAFGTVGVLGAAQPAAAAGPAEPPTPQWSIVQVIGQPTHFTPGSKDGTYEMIAANVGEAETDKSKQIVLSDRLPAGLKPTYVELVSKGSEDLGTRSPTAGFLEYVERYFEENFPGQPSPYGPPWCKIEPAIVCEYPGHNILSPYLEAVEPGNTIELIVHFEVEPGAQGPFVDSASISGGGGGNVSATSFPNQLSEATLPFGYQGYELAARNRDQTKDTQAGGHPFSLTTTATYNTEISPPTKGSERALYFPASEEPHTTVVDFPPGVIANPQAVPQCKLSDFWTSHCSQETQVGTIDINSNPFGNYTGRNPYDRTNVYNLQPELGHAANLGYLAVVGLPFILTSKVETGSDYSIATTSESPGVLLYGFSLELWGVPAAEHPRGMECNGKYCLRRTPDETNAPETPYVRMSTDCSDGTLTTTSYTDTWEHFGAFTPPFSSTMPPPDGCNAVPFEPSFQAHTSTNLADAPSGLDVDLHVPQNETPNGVSTSDVRDVSFALPEGVRLNPAAADGRVGCTLAQFAMHSPGPSSCPNASKIGEVEIESPLQDHPLPGSVYIAQQDENPFGSLFALYAVVEDPISGVIIKLAGRIDPDPHTGQLTTTFEESPQLPFEDFKLHLFGGAGAVLRTPSTCGTYGVNAKITPYSAPESGPPATPSATFDINGSAAGTCPQSDAEVPAAPVFHAGTASPQAGKYSPFSFRLSREDGSQEFRSVETTLPPGLIGKLAGIPYCSDAQIAAALTKSGRQEIASPSCPRATEVGTVDVAAGAGPDPVYVEGHAYLTGPYKGAPVGLAVITPAVAGPFDLGAVVTRVALYIDPETTQVRAVSDPLPTILRGVPLDIRSFALKLARPSFTLNPTSCEEMTFAGNTLSALGAVSPLAQRFQVGGCNTLPFKPHLGLTLKGNMKHRGHPSLRAVVTSKSGEANISSAQVTLPATELLDQSHIPRQGVCTKVQFASDSCPQGSVYGWATAKTPLLDQPLKGPVYLRSSQAPNHTLPDLVADLRGQIHVVLVGRIDSVHGGIRNTFEAVPDAPISTFVLQMKGGKKGLLENSTNICVNRGRATILVEGHNGKVHDTEPLLKLPCGHQGKHHQRQGHHGKRTR